MRSLHQQPVLTELTDKGIVSISDPKDFSSVVLGAKMPTDHLLIV